MSVNSFSREKKKEKIKHKCGLCNKQTQHNIFYKSNFNSLNFNVQCSAVLSSSSSSSNRNRKNQKNSSMLKRPLLLVLLPQFMIVNLFKDVKQRKAKEKKNETKWNETKRNAKTNIISVYQKKKKISFFPSFSSFFSFF